MGYRKYWQHLVARLTLRQRGRRRTPSISTKTFIAFAVILTCVASLGSVAFMRMNEVADRLAAIRDDQLPRQASAQGIVEDIADTQMRVMRFALLASAPGDGTHLSGLAFAITTDLAATQRRLDILTRGEGRDGDRMTRLSAFAGEWASYAGSVRELLQATGVDAARTADLTAIIDDKFSIMSSNMTMFAWEAGTEMSASLTNARNDALVSRNWLALGGVAGLGIGLLIAAAFARSIVHPIQAVTRAMRHVSAGDADFELAASGRGDEIGQMVEAIKGFRDTTQTHADTIASQNRVIDAALNNMSQGLCMFDASERIIVSNQRYRDMFGPVRERIEAHCTLSELLYALQSEGVTDEEPELCLNELRAALATGLPTRRQRTLTDGRTFAISRCPLPDGGWVATHEDITERIAAEARIAHMARHDPLTDLPNRASMREQLQQALARVHRGEMVALHYIDLDHFKNINDTLGHLFGDDLLKAVADRLRSCVREMDLVARLGGDEFAIVQAGVEKPGDAAVLAQRVQDVMRKPFVFGDQEAGVDTSIGIAIAPADGSDVEELLKSADIAAYAAKAAGRGTYRFFETEMDQRVRERRAIESGLRNALVNGEFRLHYQPIVNLQTDRISTFEALIRWFHPERGRIGPSDFIPIAEECGLIVPIGEWVLRQACRDAASWPDDVKVAVNLSPAQFNKQLVQTVVSALASAGLPPRRLELEITESVLMQNTFATLQTLNLLHDLGVKFSMDDFGTGYSSLSYLRSFPFDKIKIDRSFVTDLSQHENSTAIIRAVTLLAESLDMMTTVEGVETQEQLDHVRALGCTEMQGYLLSPPRDVADIHAMLAEKTPKADAA
jgi:diguanylate cyclase (GGDEF)-like protein